VNGEINMMIVDENRVRGLLEACDPPCLSVYQQTHRYYPDNKQDPIRFVNLVKQLEDSLSRRLSKEDTKKLLRPFLRLAEDKPFWKSSLDGLAVLCSKGVFHSYRLQRPVPNLAIVADSFHIKPLVRILQSADRYQVLGLTRKHFKLFEGNRDVLDEIKPAGSIPQTITEALGKDLTEPHQTVASYGGIGAEHSPMHHGHGDRKSEIEIDTERFFRVVDRGILENHSQPSRLPLILAALPEHHHVFHQVSSNPFLIEESIAINPDAVSSSDELRQRAWEVIEPTYLAWLDELVDRFGNAKSAGLGEEKVTEISKAVVSGRVDTLLVEADRQIPGRVNELTGEITFTSQMDPQTDDVLDDLATLALKKGGKAVIIASERMPTDTGIAAIYRY
jgi:hypothetical protein